MSKLFFKPWKPLHFNGTLILAESCPKGNETSGITGWLDHPDAEWPYNFIVQHVKVKSEQDDDTFKILRLSFLYDGGVLDPSEFWQRHGFTNVVPRFMDHDENDKIERPNKGEDKRAALEQFPLIIEFIAPQRILITSAWVVESIKELFDGGGYKKFERDDIWESTFKGIPLIGIYHPKARGYSKEGYLEMARIATARLLNLSKEYTNPTSEAFTVYG